MLYNVNLSNCHVFVFTKWLNVADAALASEKKNPAVSFQLSQIFFKEILLYELKVNVNSWLENQRLGGKH